MVTLLPSLVFSDPLADLTDVTIALLEHLQDEHPLQVRCAWEDEPGEYRWLLEKTGTDVAVRILGFEQTYSKLEDGRGALIFSSAVPVLKFAIQVKTQLRELLSEAGAEQYAVLARRPFPMAAYEKLSRSVNAEQQLERQRERDAEGTPKRCLAHKLDASAERGK
jgi:hypothetical protein